MKSPIYSPSFRGIMKSLEDLQANYIRDSQTTGGNVSLRTVCDSIWRFIEVFMLPLWLCFLLTSLWFLIFDSLIIYPHCQGKSLKYIRFQMLANYKKLPIQPTNIPLWYLKCLFIILCLYISEIKHRFSLHNDGSFLYQLLFPP